MAASPKIEINTTDMILKENHQISVIVGDRSIQIDVSITPDNEVILTDYTNLLSTIYRIAPLLRGITGGNDISSKLLQVSQFPTPEVFFSIVGSRIQLVSMLKDDWRCDEIIKISNSLTSTNIIEICKQNQICLDNFALKRIQLRSFEEPNGFIQSYCEILELKRRYPHLDLSFLKKERIGKQIDDLIHFYTAIPFKL